MLPLPAQIFHNSTMTTISHGLCTQSFASLAPTANRAVSPCPCALLAPAGCHLQHPPLTPLETNHRCPFPVQSDFRRHAGELLLKLGNWKASQFLLHQDFIISFEVNFQIHQTHLCSNGSMKMHVKIKNKSFLWLSPVLYCPCPCLPALHLLTERSSLSMHKQMARRRTRFLGKNGSEIFKVLFLFSILAIHPSEAEVTLIKGF